MDLIFDKEDAAEMKLVLLKKKTGIKIKTIVNPTAKPATETHDSLVGTGSAEISCSDGTSVDGSSSDASLSSSV